MRSRRKSHYSLYKPGNRQNTIVFRILKYLLTALIIYNIITVFIFTTIFVSNNSMASGIEHKDRVLIFNLYFPQFILKNSVKIPGIRNPMRADVVIYKPSYEKNYPWYLRSANSVVNFFTLQKKNISTKENYTNRLNLSRVVGVPGDTIFIKDNIAYIMPEGSSAFISELELAKHKYNVDIVSQLPDWNSAGNPFSFDSDEIKIPQGYYFLMGDNRGPYIDSRNQALVPIHDIKGKAIFRYWPFKRIDVF